MPTRGVEASNSDTLFLGNNDPITIVDLHAKRECGARPLSSWVTLVLLLHLRSNGSDANCSVGRSIRCRWNAEKDDSSEKQCSGRSAHAQTPNVCRSAAATAREIVAPTQRVQRLPSAAAAELDGGS